MNDPIDQSTIMAIDQIANTIFYVEFVFALIGVCLTIPHLYISTRKSMRTSSTNSLIVGIAVCDLFVLSVILFDRIYAFIRPIDRCHHQLTYFSQVAFILTHAFQDTFTRTSFWLGLALALIRLVIIKCSMRVKSKAWSKVASGCILLVFVVNFLVTGNYYFRMRIMAQGDWKPPQLCADYPPNFHETSYIARFPDTDKSYVLRALQIYQLVRGSSQVAVSIIYPILAIFLFFEIRKSARLAERLSHQTPTDRNRTSRMVLLMTVSYVISTAPQGVFYILQTIASPRSILELLVGYGSVLFSILFTINTTAHCLICFSMSSEYRKTVRKVLRIKGKEVPPEPVHFTRCPCLNDCHNGQHPTCLHP